MLTLYINFFYYQLYKYGSYWPYETVLFKVGGDFLLNLVIAIISESRTPIIMKCSILDVSAVLDLSLVMERNLVLYQPLLTKKINIGAQLAGRRGETFPVFYENSLKVLWESGLL